MNDIGRRIESLILIMNAELGNMKMHWNPENDSDLVAINESAKRIYESSLILMHLFNLQQST